jgi:hypothetical protein
MSRHSGGGPPQGDDEERDPWRPVSARKPRRQRVVLNDSRHPVTVVRVITELEEQTSVGEALVRNLVRAQLRLALWLALLTVVLFGSLPLAWYLSPAFATASVFGVRLPWLLLGVLPFPVLFGIGLWYNRIAERHEKDFVNMVEG